jgi:hypothetical protein
MRLKRVIFGQNKAYIPDHLCCSPEFECGLEATANPSLHKNMCAIIAL